MVPAMTEPDSSSDPKILQVTLLEASPKDRELMKIMTRKTAPRWMRLAACIAMEGRKLVLVRDGHPVMDRCPRCGIDRLYVLHALHKKPAGGDTRAVIECTTCHDVIEDKSLTVLERRPENPLKRMRGSF